MPAPDTTAAFAVRPDPHCLRGLHFVYSTRRPVATDRLIDSVRRAYPEQSIEGIEQWGSRTVQRLIVQFRFEIRIGVRQGEISFLHRVHANLAQRARDRASFESSLLTALEGEAAP